MKRWTLAVAFKGSTVARPSEIVGDAAWMVEHVDVLLADPTVSAMTLTSIAEPKTEAAMAKAALA